MVLRIVLIGNSMSTMLRFRGSLIKALRVLGHDVIAICPAGTLAEEQELANLGVLALPLDSMSRQGLNPWAELKLLYELTAMLQKVAPDRVFSCFIKPAIWGSIAAKLAGVPRRVAMIEGMGYAFSVPPRAPLQKIRQATARVFILQLLKLAHRCLDHLIVLNVDDAQLLRDRTLIPEARLFVLDGIGVDLDHFAPAPPQIEPIRFLLAARLIREKGIEMFVECASVMRKIYPMSRFRIVGGLDHGPGALSAACIERWVRDGLVEWPGHVADIRPHLRESSVFVLPTFYGEGLPRSTMEAMAMARPVITSDMRGARGSVTHGVSGFVHPVGNLSALVAACTHFCETPMDIARMGQAALGEARLRYALDTQNQSQINLIIGPERLESY